MGVGHQVVIEMHKKNNNEHNYATNSNRATTTTAMGSNMGSNSIRSNSNQSTNVEAVTNQSTNAEAVTTKSNRSCNVQAAASNTQSGTASSVDNNTDNTFTHPYTLDSLLWSNEEDSNTTINNNVQSQSLHPLNCYDDAYTDGDESAMDRLLHLMDNNLDEAEQLLGYRVDNVDDLLRLLEERETDSKSINMEVKTNERLPCIPKRNERLTAQSFAILFHSSSVYDFGI